MNVSSWNLDELVAGVMADLRAANVALDSSPSGVSRALAHDFQSVRPAEKHSDSTGPDASRSDVFQVEERTIVVETALKLAARATSKRWNVPANAVITPAARDELKKLGVEIITCKRSAFGKSATDESKNAASGATATAGEARRPTVLAITHAPNDERPSKTVADYLARNAEFVERRFDCLKETTRVISDEIAKAPELKVVLTTGDMAIALIWANRYKGVRAIGVFSTEQAQRDIAATNANVVVLNPRELGSYQTRRVLDYFVRFERK